MTWLGINDFCDPAIWNGRTCDPLDDINNHAIFATGTVVLEGEYAPDATRDRYLLNYHNNHGWARYFLVVLSKDGDVDVDIRQGSGYSHFRIQGAIPAIGSRTRISISCVGQRRAGEVTVENIDTGEVKFASDDNAVPLPVGDLKSIVQAGPALDTTTETTLIAVADSIEPTGLTPGFASDCMITTQDGPRPIERLALGDLVLCEQYGFQPIRWIFERTLPACGYFAPMRLRAPYLGLARDITVAQHQRIKMAGAAAEYNFGNESVVVNAGHMLGHPTASPAPRKQIVRYYQLVVDHHDCIEVGGIWCESQSLSAIRMFEGLHAAHPLRNVPTGAIPRHTRPVEPALQPYETTCLLGTYGG